MSKGTEEETSDHFGEYFSCFCSHVWVVDAWIKKKEERKKERKKKNKYLTIFKNVYLHICVRTQQTNDVFWVS